MRLGFDRMGQTCRHTRRNNATQARSGCGASRSPKRERIPRYPRLFYAPPIAVARVSGHTEGVNANPWVLHVDLDQFIAAVEVLRRPELAGKPIIVGGRGDPAERAVVSTASYEARAFGVGSGMPLRLAARKVPDAVILPVDQDAYLAASHTVMATLRAQPGVTVQVLGWDEDFLGVQTDNPEAVARQVQAAVLERTRLDCSVGIGDTLVRAKGEALGCGNQSVRPAGHARHQDRRRACRLRPARPGSRVRPQDGAVVRAARAR